MEEEKKVQRQYLIRDEDGSEAILIKNWMSKIESDALFSFCQELKTRVYPFKIRKNRPLWACGDPGTSHSFQSVKVKIEEWPKMIKDVRDRINKELDIYTNFCLLNKYENGKIGIAHHSDGELYAKKKSVITLSMGATRTMSLIPTIPGSRRKIEFNLEHGDLFIMWGNIQSKVKHGIDEQPDIRDLRISLTFRSTLLS